MDALSYMREVGRAETRRTAEKAGTTMGYFEQIAYGFRSPSFGLAERLAAASGGAMDVLSLMRAATRIAESKEASGEAA